MINQKPFTTRFSLRTDSSTNFPFLTITEAFRQLKTLYEGNSISLEVIEGNKSFTKFNASKSPAQKLRRANTSSISDVYTHEDYFEQHIAEEPYSDAFAKTRIRFSSFDKISIEDLVSSYKFRHTLKETKKKCNINLEILLEDLKRLYLSQSSENIKTLLICMTQLVAIFMLSSASDLRKGKCKHILEKLDELEKTIHSHLEGVATVPQLGNLGSQDNAALDSPNFAPCILDKTPRSSVKPFKNIKKAHSDLSDKLSHEEALRLLARMKYVIAQLGHLLHYDQIANSIERSNPEDNTNKIILSASFLKTGHNNLSLFHEDLNERTLALKVEQLKKFWQWKVQKWKQNDSIKKKKSLYHILCPICEKNIKVDQGLKHLELCKVRAELNKRLGDQDNKMSDIVFQSFKNIKSLQKGLMIDRKRKGRLQAKLKDQQLGFQKPILRQLTFGQVISKKTRAASAESKEQPKFRRQSTKRLTVEPYMNISPRDERRNQSETRNVDERSKIELLQVYALPKGKYEINTRLKKRLKDRMPKSADRKSIISAHSEEKSADKVMRTKKPGHFKKLRISVGNQGSDSYKKEEKMNFQCVSALDNVRVLTTSDESSDNKSTGGDTGRSVYNSENGSESPAVSDLSFTEPNFIEKNLPSRSLRSQSFAYDGGMALLHKKSKFFLGKEASDNNAEGEEIIINKDDENLEPQTQANLERMSSSEKMSMFRRSRTAADEIMREFDIKKDEIRAREEKDTIEKLKKLKTSMNQKKLKIRLYEFIQYQGKSMLNQTAYSKEMELLKEDILLNVQELIEQAKSESARGFADKFTDVLQKRIEVGKLFDENAKKFMKLEGRTSSGKFSELGLFRGKSSLPITSPPKNERAQSFLDDRIIYDFPRANPTRDLRFGSKVLSSNPTRFENMSEENRYQCSVSSESRNPNKRLSDYSMKEIDGEVERKISYEEDMMIVKDDKEFVPSLWNLSLADSPGLKKADQTLSMDNISVSQKLSQDNRKESVTSSVRTLNNPQSFGMSQPSIVINESLPSSGKKEDHYAAQITPDFSREPNQVFHFGKKDIQRSLTSPNNVSLKTDLLSPRRAKMLTVEPSTVYRGPPTPLLAKVWEEEPTKGGKQEDDETSRSPISPTRSPLSKYKAKTLKNLGVPKKISIGKRSPSPQRDDSKSFFPDKKRNSFKLLHILEANNKKDLDRFPSITDHPKGKHLRSDTIATFRNKFTENQVPQQENIDSFSSIDTPTHDRGYFSDSEAWKPSTGLKCHPEVGINDFEPIKMISKGAFGRVWLVRKKATKDLYAMKVINLAEKLMKNNDLENLRKENSVFSLAQEDFVVRAVFTFTHETCICFVMEYMLGGDLGDFLFNYTALDESVARFYIAEIILAVEYLHSLGIVHRDLKPDNILLDKSGHAKLTDFGLSETGLSRKMKDAIISPLRKPGKIFNFSMDLMNQINAEENEELKERTSLVVRMKKTESKDYSDQETIFVRTDSHDKNKRKANRLIGTPDYMAPEIINSVSTTSYSSDWWSIGVMLFELLAGVPPFNDDTPEKIYDNIINMRVPWDSIPIGYDEGSMSPEAVDLIKKFLNPDHLQRLGANGTREIKEHPFFKSINWNTLRTQKAPVTFEHVEDTDTQNFVRMGDKITEKEKGDPFALIPKTEDVQGNLRVAKHFIEKAQDNFHMVNISALYSAGLKLAEETMKEKAKDLKQIKQNAQHARKFSDVFDTPEQ